MFVETNGEKQGNMFAIEEFKTPITRRKYEICVDRIISDVGENEGLQEGTRNLLSQQRIS
jgi:hypothetical protein